MKEPVGCENDVTRRDEKFQPNRAPMSWHAAGVGWIE
jgi:hypothetical protein